MRRKLRIVRIIITEITIMALGVVCCIMPMPWRLVVPIIIGTRSILIKAHMRIKESPPPEAIVENVTEFKTNKEKKGHAEKKQNCKTTARQSGKAASKAAEKGGNKKAA